MGLKKKIETKIDKAKAENDCAAEKLQADIDSKECQKN